MPRPRTLELYEGELRLHILPSLGAFELAGLTSARIRTWHADLLRSGLGPTTVAKCYRLLRAILTTAVEDSLLARNPSVIKGAGVESAPESTIATLDQVFALADAIDPSFKAMVLLATFTGLRLAELRALRRRNLDLEHGSVSVVEQLQELADGSLVLGPPKSKAGRRTVAIPAAIVTEMQSHLDRRSDAGPNGYVFAGTKGQPFRRATFYKAWQKAAEAVALGDFRFHDLRHTGNTLGAMTGASTKELMARMGHSSPRSALIYQHATQERDIKIAQALSEAILRTQAPATPA